MESCQVSLEASSIYLNVRLKALDYVILLSDLFWYNIYLRGVKHKNIKIQIFYFVENFAFNLFLN